MLLTTFALATTLFGASTPIVVAQEFEPRDLYNRAVGHYNERRLEEAHALLGEIVSKHPRAFYAYRLWWKSTGKASGEATLRETVEANLEFLATVAIDDRTETYYYVVMAGEELLGRTERAESWRREALERLPGSKIAQQDLLARADETEDPVVACALYAEFLETYSGNVSWSVTAARKRFDRMIDARDRFELDEAIEAARVVERLSLAFAKTYGQQSKVLFHAMHIAGSLLPRAPEEALAIAERAHAWTLKTAPTTEEFTPSVARIFLPFRLVVHQRLERHEDAVRAGDDLFPANDLAHPYYPRRSTGLNEADLRYAHGVSLSSVGRHAAAVEQLVYANHLDHVHGPALDAARAAALAAEITLPRLDERVAAFDETRRVRRKKEVLGSEVRIAATPFDLIDLAGEHVTLNDFKGRTLILNFWATW